MIDEIKKSISSTLYERTTSPFFGSLILSWTVWNWKILYLTIFIDEKSIAIDKISYITTNFWDYKNLLIYPIISTIILLTIVPFISNGAYWLSLKFNKWKKDQKHLVEMKELLTLEQSIKLREQINEQEKRFDKLIESKNLEINQLNKTLEISSKIESSEIFTDKFQNELEDLSTRFKENEEEKANYDKIITKIQRGYKFDSSSTIDPDIVTLLESFEIIKNKGGAMYELTETGKKFHRLISK